MFTQPIYTKKEAAEALRISVEMLDKLRFAKPPRIRAVAFGRAVRFTAEELKRFVEASVEQPEPVEV